MRATTLLALLLITAMALAALACSPPAEAQQVHRCTDAAGTSVFTDRGCEDVGATSHLIGPRLDTGEQPVAAARRGCPRKLSELVQQITGAIEAGNANRLALLYRWNGVSDASANRLLDQMEILVRRPLVDIAPVFPEAAPTSVVDASGTMSDANAAGNHQQPAPPQKRPPVGLRLQQTLANSGTLDSTVLGIRRSDGCFWITL